MTSPRGEPGRLGSRVPAPEKLPWTGESALNRPYRPILRLRVTGQETRHLTRHSCSLYLAKQLIILRL